MKLQPNITHAGQAYVDEPVLARAKPVAQALAQAFGRRPLPEGMVLAYERVRLRWMKPDGKGGFVPTTTAELQHSAASP